MMHTCAVVYRSTPYVDIEQLEILKTCVRTCSRHLSSIKRTKIGSNSNQNPGCSAGGFVYDVSGCLSAIVIKACILLFLGE